jgi:hypothetical protein
MANGSINVKAVTSFPGMNLNVCYIRGILNFLNFPHYLTSKKGIFWYAYSIR